MELKALGGSSSPYAATSRSHINNSRSLNHRGYTSFTPFYGSKLVVLRWSNKSLPKRSSREARAMFTGLVEEMGRVMEVGMANHDQDLDDKAGFHMTIHATTVLEALHLGDSIAINGACLTVTRVDSHSFTVGLSPETLRRTSLNEATLGSPVNLERSLQPLSRMGGHFVQGHVDGTATIVSMEQEDDSLWLKIKTSPEILRYVVPKGFIAVDGVSLTVVDVHDDECAFTFMLVAYTQQKIILPSKKIGSKVNLEVDILGKYVERLLQGYRPSA